MFLNPPAFSVTIPIYSTKKRTSFVKWGISVLVFSKKEKPVYILFGLLFASLVGALILELLSPLAITREVHFIMKNLIGVSVTVSVVLVLLLSWKKLHVVSKILLGLFSVIIFLALYLFPVRVDYMLYLGHLAVCILCFLIFGILWLIRKEGRYLLDAFLPLVYSVILNFIKAFDLEEHITTDTDGLFGKLLLVAGICGIITVLIYVILQKGRSDKKEYFGAMFGFFCLAFVFALVIPMLCAQTINYTFDTSDGTEAVYTVVDKYIDYNREAADDYCLVVMQDNEELEIQVSGFRYHELEFQDSITLRKHDGFFGLSYYEYGTENYT